MIEFWLNPPPVEEQWLLIARVGGSKRRIHCRADQGCAAGPMLANCGKRNATETAPPRRRPSRGLQCIRHDLCLGNIRPTPVA